MTHDQTPFEDGHDRDEFELDRALWRRAAGSGDSSTEAADDASVLNELAAMLDGRASAEERDRLEAWLAERDDRTGLLGPVPAAADDVRPLVLERARSLVSGAAPMVETMANRPGRVLRWIGSVAASIMVGALGYTMGTTSPAPADVAPTEGIQLVRTSNVELVSAMSFGTLDNASGDDELSDDLDALFALDEMGDAR